MEVSGVDLEKQRNIYVYTLTHIVIIFLLAVFGQRAEVHHAADVAGPESSRQAGGSTKFRTRPAEV